MRNNLFDEYASMKYFKPIPTFKRFKFWFKMIDMYALPITLRYKNQKMFYTNFGAIISLVVYIIVLSLMTSYLRIVF